jgi:peptide/nickel transport system substrate-binding protein
MMGSNGTQWGEGPIASCARTPGVELVLEANERYWRKVPSIKRIIFKGVPENPTRLAMLKTGEADIAYLMYREEGDAIRKYLKLRLVRSFPPVTWYLDFPEQWDPKCPWHDKRVRLAVNYAIDR